MGLILFSCGSIKPKVPVISITEVSLPEQKVSFIYLPIEVNLDPYLKMAEKELPNNFKGKVDNCEGYNYTYSFDRKPLKIEGKGQEIEYNVPGSYLLYLNYCPKCTNLFDVKGTCVIPRIYASCGVDESKRRIELSFATKFKVTSKYKLETETKLKKINPIDDCKLTIVNYNATEKLVEEMESGMKTVSKMIDTEIGKFDLKKMLEGYWKTLQEPINIGTYGKLLVAPNQLFLGNYSVINKTLKLEIGLSAYPKVQTETSEIHIKPLPELLTMVQAEHFSMNLQIQASYDSLSSILNQQLAGDTLVLKGKIFKIDSIKVLGADNNALHVQVKFSGNKKGTLYLTGTPSFDENTQVISFPDMHFDLDTKNALLKSGKWLFNDRITNLIRSNSRFELKPELDKLKLKLKQELNKEIPGGVKLSGDISRLEVNLVHPSKDKLYIHVGAHGKLKVNL
jgi:hypothetical protein